MSDSLCLSSLECLQRDQAHLSSRPYHMTALYTKLSRLLKVYIRALLRSSTCLMPRTQDAHLKNVWEGGGERRQDGLQDAGVQPAAAAAWRP